jgi:hypothetical protein
VTTATTARYPLPSLNIVVVFFLRPPSLSHISSLSQLCGGDDDDDDDVPPPPPAPYQQPSTSLRRLTATRERSRSAIGHGGHRWWHRIVYDDKVGKKGTLTVSSPSSPVPHLRDRLPPCVRDPSSLPPHLFGERDNVIIYDGGTNDDGRRGKAWESGGGGGGGVISR